MKAKWIWYYGDFEIYHSLKLHTRREEYDYMFPPFWKLDDCHHNVKFKKEVDLKSPEKITVFARGVGHAELDGKRYPFEREILVPEGRHTIIVYAADAYSLPCAYVDGESIISDESWLASYYGRDWTFAGCNNSYTEKDHNPQIFNFCYEEITPLLVKEIKNGTLYDFGKETFAKLCFNKLNCGIDIFYGETETEALDMADTYLRTHIDTPKELPCRAFRYIFIPEVSSEEYSFRAYYEYLPLEEKGFFKCSDELINRIWDTSVYTFHLNSREFFLDGIKRDRWVWSGDAYQSYMVNRYIFFDEEIAKRTILALLGNTPIEKHINTILDYSFYWIMSIYDHYEMTGDFDFIERIYPKMKSLMDFCLSRLDENGFASKIDDDWIFIDWAEIDKTGAVCAEQMLLLKSLESMEKCEQLLGIQSEYKNHAKVLKEKINKFFWCKEKGAYIDSFESGKNNVSRHANIFALLFGIADEKQREMIIENVLLNEKIPHIKTPYFKFYELEAMCNTGDIKKITEQIRSYWGGMLNLSATSFWEEYNPEKTDDEQLKMYADKFGKSLCHAWGASPIYLIGKYYMGVNPTSAGYETFEVRPHLGGLEWFSGIVPIKGGSVSISIKYGILEVLSDKDGGTLIYDDKKYPLEKGKKLLIGDFCDAS